jgi:hypothetical protein
MMLIPRRQTAVPMISQKVGRTESMSQSQRMATVILPVCVLGHLATSTQGIAIPGGDMDNAGRRPHQTPRHRHAVRSRATVSLGPAVPVKDNPGAGSP